MNTDLAIHLFFSSKDSILWNRLKDEDVVYYYAEDGLYVFKANNAYYFGRGKSPWDAWERLHST